jgi:hypothetical protein
MKEGEYTGIDDKNGVPINEGDKVKILIGKKNDGYRVVFRCGAFCFTGHQLGGEVSFIKFRDELRTGLITGKPVLVAFNKFLEVIEKDAYRTASAELSNSTVEEEYSQPQGTGSVHFV